MSEESRREWGQQNAGTVGYIQDLQRQLAEANVAREKADRTVEALTAESKRLVDAGAALLSQVAELQSKLDEAEEDSRSVRTDRDGLQYRMNLDVVEDQRLRARIAELESEREREKQSRIKYQDIVYAICNKLDALSQRRAGYGLLARKEDIVAALTALAPQPAAPSVIDVLKELPVVGTLQSIGAPGSGRFAPFDFGGGDNIPELDDALAREPDESLLEHPLDVATAATMEGPEDEILHGIINFLEKLPKPAGMNVELDAIRASIAGENHG